MDTQIQACSECTALRLRLQEHDVILRQIQDGQLRIQRQIETFLYASQDQAKHVRGSRGMDFQLYQQFMTAQMADALVAFQSSISETIQSSLRLDYLDFLRKETEENVQKFKYIYSNVLRFMDMMEHTQKLFDQIVQNTEYTRELQEKLQKLSEKAKETEQKLQISQELVKRLSVEKDTALQKVALSDEILQTMEAFRVSEASVLAAHSKEARLASVERHSANSNRDVLLPRELVVFPPTIRKCFYTASIGNPGQTTDTIKPFPMAPGWDYILFTNLPLQSTSWQIRQVSRTYGDPAVDAKQYKWLSHKYLPDYDVVVWIDSYMSPIPKLVPTLEDILYRSMFEDKLFIVHRPHAERTCIWDECDAVVKARRATPQSVEKNRALLHNVKMPHHFGLFDTNIVAKLHMEPIVQTLGEAILDTLKKASNRDQLAVTYIYYTHDFHKYTSKELQTYFMKTGTHIRIPAYL